MSKNFYFVEDNGDIRKISTTELKEAARLTREFEPWHKITIADAEFAITGNTQGNPFFESFCFSYEEARALSNVRTGNL